MSTTVEIPVDTSELEVKLRKVQDELDDLRKKFENVAPAANKLKGSADKLNDSFGKAGQSSAKAAGALSLISPAAGDATRNLADLADVGELAASAGSAIGVSAMAVGSALAVVALAIGVAAIAWKDYNREARLVEKTNKDISDGLKDLQPINKLSTDSALELEKALGKITDSQYALARGTEVARKAQLDSTVDARKAITAAEKAREGLEDWTSEYKEQAQVIKENLVVIDSANRAYEKTVSNLEGIKAATDRKTASDKAAAKEAKKLAEDKKAEADAQKLLNDLIKKYGEESKISNEILTEADRKQEKQAKEELEESQRADAAADDREHERTRVLAEEIAKRIDLERSYLAAVDSSASSIANLVETLNQRQLDAIDTTTEAGRKAAGQQWAENKAAAIATAVVQAALGVAIAAASAPPPLNLPAVIAATAAGITNIAAVSSAEPPKFHSGTSRVGETGAILEDNEAILTSGAADKVGRKNIDRLNSGRDPYTKQAPMIIQYRHKEYNRFMLDNIRSGGPVANSLNRNSSVGHRSERS